MFDLNRISVCSHRNATTRHATSVFLNWRFVLRLACLIVSIKHLVNGLKMLVSMSIDGATFSDVFTIVELFSSFAWPLFLVGSLASVEILVASVHAVHDGSVCTRMIGKRKKTANRDSTMMCGYVDRKAGEIKSYHV